VLPLRKHKPRTPLSTWLADVPLRGRWTGEISGRAKNDLYWDRSRVEIPEASEPLPDNGESTVFPYLPYP
jgi:hypothetical protein